MLAAFTHKDAEVIAVLGNVLADDRTRRVVHHELDVGEPDHGRLNVSFRR